MKMNDTVRVCMISAVVAVGCEKQPRETSTPDDRSPTASSVVEEQAEASEAEGDAIEASSEATEEEAEVEELAGTEVE